MCDAPTKASMLRTSFPRTRARVLIVVPAQAGPSVVRRKTLDSRVRGNDNGQAIVVIEAR